MEVVQLIFVRTAYYVHQHCFSAHCTKWLFRVTKFSLSVKSKPNVTYLVYKLNLQKCYDSGGIRTHAPEENSALNYRLGPLGHAILLMYFMFKCFSGQKNLLLSQLSFDLCAKAWNLNEQVCYLLTICLFSFCQNQFTQIINMRPGCRHSSVDSSAPSILPSRVWVPSTPSTLVEIVYLSFECEKNKNKQKRGRDWPFF